MEPKKLIIAISSCLLGEKVRYDGKSKRENTLIEKLEKIVLLLPVCPEIEVGMTVPRERVRLEGDMSEIKMIAEESGKDWTKAMTDYSYKRIIKLDFKKVSGVILKRKSPSCGIKSAMVFNNDSFISKKGDGLFTSIIQKRYPKLPIIDELSLQDSGNFIRFIHKVNVYAHEYL